VFSDKSGEVVLFMNISNVYHHICKLVVQKGKDLLW